MPMTMSCTPSAPPRLMICSSAGTMRLAAVQAEALGAGEALVQEALEALGLDQLLQDGDLALRREGDLLVAALDALLQPGLLVGIGDVHVLHADVAAVGARAGSPGSRGGSRSPGPAHSRGRSAGRSRSRRSRSWPGRARLASPLSARPSGSRLAAQVAAHPVGADHHDGAQGIQGARRGPRPAMAAGLRRSIALAASLASTAGHRPSMADSQSGRGGGRRLGRPGRLGAPPAHRVGLLVQRCRRRRARRARPSCGSAAQRA